MSNHPSDCLCDVCSGKIKADDVLPALARKVETFGWAAIGVFPDSKHSDPWYIYTIGFSKRFPGCPEFVVSGLPGTRVQPVFHAIFDRMAAGEIHHDQAEFVEQFLKDYPVILLPVPAATGIKHFGFAAPVLGTMPRYVQVVWPDKEYRWPWQPKYDSAPQKLYGVRAQ